MFFIPDYSDAPVGAFVASAEPDETHGTAYHIVIENPGTYSECMDKIHTFLLEEGEFRSFECWTPTSDDSSRIIGWVNHIGWRLGN